MSRAVIYQVLVYIFLLYLNLLPFYKVIRPATRNYTPYREGDKKRISVKMLILRVDNTFYCLMQGHNYLWPIIPFLIYKNDSAVEYTTFKYIFFSRVAGGYTCKKCLPYQKIHPPCLNILTTSLRYPHGWCRSRLWMRSRKERIRNVYISSWDGKVKFEKRRRKKITCTYT